MDYGTKQILISRKGCAEEKGDEHYQKELQRWFEVLQKETESGAMIPRPATDDDIEQCNNEMLNYGLEPLPTDYVAFLKLCNGLAWNGFEFYGTDVVSYADDPDGYKLMDIVSKTDEYDERYYENHKQELLYFGRWDDDIYVYNYEEKRYETRQMEEGCAEVSEEYGTFAELFADTVGKCLDAVIENDLDEQQYEHDEGKYDGES